MAESKLQVSFINWMKDALPEVLVWHVYNETGRNSRDPNADKWAEIQGRMKKDRGVMSGVHDNHLAWPHRNFATIELKDPDKPVSANKYSPKQAEFALRLDECGFPHACCQNGGQIEAAVRLFGLAPKFRFPSSLDSSKRQMLQMTVAEMMYRRD